MADIKYRTGDVGTISNQYRIGDPSVDGYKSLFVDGYVFVGELRYNQIIERWERSSDESTYYHIFDSEDVIPEENGGTNQSTYITGDILYASGADTLDKLPIGPDGYVLTVDGSNVSWKQTLNGPVDGYASEGGIAYFSDSTGDNLSDSQILTDGSGNITSIGYLNLESLDPATISHQQGKIFYDSTDEALAVMTDIADVTLQVGQESYVRVVNKTGSTIPDGYVVYINGAQGNRPTIALADASNEATTHILGVATHNIANNAEGQITTFGLVRNLDTSSWAPGTKLYLSTTPGFLTDTKPTGTNIVQEVGTVTVQHNNEGIILVQIRATDHLEYLHDVCCGIPYDGYLLAGDGYYWNSVPAASVSVGGVAGVVLVSGLNKTSYSTITAALADASSGDMVLVGPGNWAESVTVPAGVSLNGAGSSFTFITGGASTGTRVTLNNGSYFKDIGVYSPTNAAPAILGPSGSSDRAVVRDAIIVGISPLASGIECQNGDLIVYNVYQAAGVIGTIFDVTGGRFTGIQTYHFDGYATNVWRINSGTLVGDTFGVQQGTNVTNAMLVETGATVSVSGCIFLQCTNGINVTADDVYVSIVSGRFDSTNFALLVDDSVTSGTVHLNYVEMNEDEISVGPVFSDSADFLIIFQNEKEGSVGLDVRGEFRVGSPERGDKTSLGEGTAYTRGMVVLTTDNTAGQFSDGGNFTDVSEAASSSSGSTFTFQGSGENYSILFCSSLDNSDGYVKHYGYEMYQTTAAVEDGYYIVERWDGYEWAETKRMISSEKGIYIYDNSMFIRANSTEYCRLRLSINTTWETKVINGVDGYWTRIRTTGAPSTLPVFEQWKLLPSNVIISEEGIYTASGNARWRETLQSSGNVFGESGGVTSGTIAVGSGGLPTGWDHAVKNSILNGNGDALYFQFNLPKGICSSCPLNFTITYSLIGAQPVTVDPQIIFSVLPIEVSGILTTDLSGGIPTIPRSESDTAILTANQAQTQTKSLTANVNNKAHSIEFNDYFIDEYSEGDLVLVRFEMDDDGTPNQDLLIWTVQVSGVKWTFGERLQ